MLDLNVTKSELLMLAAQLGADVPIFIFAQSAWAQGIGEQLEVLKLPKKHFLVLHPKVFVSTRQLFCSSELTRDCSPITIRAFLDGEGKNVFQPLVLKQYPEVRKAYDWLSQFATTKLTGTGACLFAQFDTEQQAIGIKNQVPNCWNSWVVKGLNESPLHQL
jgi:4-diphosphocytidyl-2-C-methyl-D-erythritol kinase